MIFIVLFRHSDASRFALLQVSLPTFAWLAMAVKRIEEINDMKREVCYEVSSCIEIGGKENETMSSTLGMAQMG